jgi:hypothetical protein
MGRSRNSNLQSREGGSIRDPEELPNSDTGNRMERSGPLFIKEGEIVRISTQTGEFASRA